MNALAFDPTTPTRARPGEYTALTDSWTSGHMFLNFFCGFAYMAVIFSRHWRNYAFAIFELINTPLHKQIKPAEGQQRKRVGSAGGVYWSGGCH